MRSCDAIVGVSDRVSRTLTAHFRLNPDRVHTIENGVDVRVFENCADQRRDLRERFGFDPQDVVIGHVANFRHNKNHLFLLKSFREVLRERPHARLILVGQGFAGDPENSEEDIAKYIHDHDLQNSVSSVGHRSDVHDFLAMMDIFCLVSHREGLPLSLIEAMASGLPVLGTEVEGIRGVIEPGVNGLLVGPDDVSGLSLALKRLIDDVALRQRMGAASREAARHKYALTRCIEETERLFLTIQGALDLGAERALLAVRQ